MIKIAVIDVGGRHIITESIAQNENIDLLGSIISVADLSEHKALSSYYEQLGCPIVDFGDLKQLNIDFLLVINCPKIINMDLIDGIRVLNLHGGILPKYRGFSANAWAIINGEKEVGYSLHELTAQLDGGDIYKIYKQPITENEHYGEVRERLEQMVCNDLSKTLEEIKNNSITPISQTGQEHFYMTKLHKEDGIIDWNKDTDYIYSLFRTMAKPYGTGVFFKYKEKTYEITKMNRAKGFGKYICISGAVVYKEDSSIIVKTADTAVQIEELQLNGETIVPSETFKIGTRL